MQIDRRTFLVGLGAGAGWIAARGLGARGLADAGDPADFAATLRELGASLTPLQREHVVFPADHPSRQINNTFAIVKGPHLGTLLSPTAAEAAGPALASMLIYLLMAVVLALRPEGLFPAKGR